MDGFFETSSYWQGGFTEEQNYYYKEHRLSPKGKHLWEQIDKLNTIARDVCSSYDVTYCFDKSCYCRRYKHLPFQCEYNDNVTISSYVKGNYDFYDVEQIEEFIAFKVHLNLPVCLKILMMHLMNMRFMRYLNFALKITRKQIAIFLNILVGAFHNWKRLMPCRSLWKKKLLK